VICCTDAVKLLTVLVTYSCCSATVELNDAWSTDCLELALVMLPSSCDLSAFNMHNMHSKHATMKCLQANTTTKHRVVMPEFGSGRNPAILKIQSKYGLQPKLWLDLRFYLDMQNVTDLYCISVSFETFCSMIWSCFAHCKFHAWRGFWSNSYMNTNKSTRQVPCW